MVRWRGVALVATGIPAAVLPDPAASITCDNDGFYAVPSSSSRPSCTSRQDGEIFSILQTKHVRPRGRAGGDGKRHIGSSTADSFKNRHPGESKDQAGRYGKHTDRGQLAPSELTFWVFVFGSICSFLLLFTQIFADWFASASEVQECAIKCEGEDEEGDEFDLDEDIYSAGIYCLIHDGKEMLSDSEDDEHKLAIWRFIFISSLLLANYAGQICLLVWTNFFVVAPSVHKVQRLYQDFHRECYSTAGVFNQTSFDNFKDKTMLCDIVFSKFQFMLVCLCVWSATMLWEHRKTDDLFRHLRLMRRAGDSGGMVEPGDDGTWRVKSLTVQTRWLLYLLIIVPKTTINIVLLIYGTIWLVATTSFSDMILNAVALEFIINIDELCFGAMVPKSLKGQIAVFKLWTAKSKYQTSQIAWSYARSIVHIFLVVVIPYWYITYGQTLPLVGVYPGYVRGQIARHCADVLSHGMYRVCLWGEICFPYGRSP